jgi:hypothetical protein
MVTFLPIYDEVILEIKKKFCTPISILEIGVQKGGSLEIWRSIFGEQAKILELTSILIVQPWDLMQKFELGHLRIKNS